MQEEIEVGEYGRTNKGKIFIFAWVVDENGNKLNYIMKLVNGGFAKYWLDENEKIVKHSHNLIDLIEERGLCEWNVSNTNHIRNKFN